MKSQMLFLQEVLDELGTWCCISTSRDYKYISARIENEGLSFLTITLPNYAKDLERALDHGKVESSHFLGYTRNGGLPRFLGGFLSQVFDRRTGCLLDKPNIDAIYAIRQVTMLFGKMELECSDERTRKAMRDYVKCEKDMEWYADIWYEPQMDDYRLQFSRISRILFARVFTNVDQKIYDGDLVPKHGPGSTADRILGNKKYVQNTWTQRLEEVFPLRENLVSNWTLQSRVDHINILEPGAELPTRVISVPKTLKTPRIIAMEPVCMQYMQQAILGDLSRATDADDIASWLVSSSSQVPNQDMARYGSSSGRLATLDLSEASDRVLNVHVETMLLDHPHLRAGVSATRSTKAHVPNEGIIPLVKFASMGSALCFPFEAMVFATVIFMGIERELKRPLTRSDVKRYRGKVRVYGDDIIVPSRFVRSVLDLFDTFGFKVNVNKSFWTGKFRESCGKDFYSGEDVSVIRCRMEFPSTRRYAPGDSKETLRSQQIASVVSLRNLLYMRGLWHTVEWLDEQIERIIPFPYVAPTSPALGRFSFLGYDIEGWTNDTQRPFVKAAVLVPRIPSDYLDDYGALLKFFLKQGAEPFADRKHLERAGRPRSVNIKTRKVQPF
jgi:hypothetical protein